MPGPNRYCPSGMVFHVLNRGVDRRVIFTKHEDFLAFERVIETAKRLGLELTLRQDGRPNKLQ